MEIYTNNVNRKVFLDVPVQPIDTSMDVTIYNGDELVHTVNTVTGEDDGRYSIVMPFDLCQNNNLYTVNWSFIYNEDSNDYVYNQKTIVEVVTSILPRHEILAIHPNATESEVFKVERAVRHIIQAHTGQVFGRFVGDFLVPGTGSNKLLLPARLISLDTINGNSAFNQFEVDAEGWVLKYFPYGVPPVKADYHAYHQHVGGVIHNPNNVKLGDFRSSITYRLTGVWGWEEVPAQVREAAKLLINDYACADQSYRDRYITSMTAADWRIQYHSGAFLETGNVRADQLLNNFVLQRGWTVI